MNEFFKNASAIIEAAAKNPLGIIALLILTFAVLAYLFFGQASESTRVKMFMLMLGLVGFVGFALVSLIISIYFPPPDQPIFLQQYCCDIFGNHRCSIVNLSYPGSSCFCPNQGYGYVCQ